MEITLEKIELVKDRTGVSYAEAKEALEAAEGSVVDAIISIEEKIDEDTYKLTFKKGIYSEVPIQTFSIRISNSGSRYEPFNTVFMSMYKKLKEYDFNNHQIHIEEYLYSKKKIKKRK